MVLFSPLRRLLVQGFVRVSPRKVNCWQKVWGGLIPTYTKLDTSHLGLERADQPDPYPRGSLHEPRERLNNSKTTLQIRRMTEVFHVTIGKWANLSYSWGIVY